MDRKSIKFLVIGALTLAMSLLFVLPLSISYAADEGGTKSADGVLPSAYCMRDDYIVYTQSQDKHGYCWNFAATMSAATTLMKATGEYYDFSELWTGLSYRVAYGASYTLGAGGGMSTQHNAMMASGLMLECDLPFQYSYNTSNENAADYYNFFEKYSNDDLASALVKDSETSFNRSEVDAIKNHILNHGSVYVAFSFRTGFVQENGEGAYVLEPNQKNTNSAHAVSIVGWDDNIERTYYFDGSDTPTVFKGAWMIMNSYTETNGDDGINYLFYEDTNVYEFVGYRYQPDTTRDLYLYDKIEESGYTYYTDLKGRYYGDFSAETAATKQKNIFYDDVSLTYSYIISDGASIEDIEIFRGDKDVTSDFNVSVDHAEKRFYISSKTDSNYGQYKVLVHYGNGENSDTYLNNFFVTQGLVGEEAEFDQDNASGDVEKIYAFNPGRDMEFYTLTSPDKTYVVYTDKLAGKISFVPKEQSVYSEQNMSLPAISYEITNGESCTRTHKFVSDSGYELEYKFVFVYCGDTAMQTVNVYYDLGGGVNHSENYKRELANAENGLALYAPTRPGYTFAGWYLDYGNGSKPVPEKDGVYYVSWDDIHHMGEDPSMRASGYYKQHYSNSNTLFVYAHWEEVEYYNIDITINGQGTTQINENILISSDDAVRYVLASKSNWKLKSIEINGKMVERDDFVEIAKNGLVMKNLKEDTSVVVTFAEGIYLSINLGDNVKDAYVIGVYNGVAKRFYDGDFIPIEYLDSVGRPVIDRPVIDIPSIKDPIIDNPFIDSDTLKDSLTKNDVNFDDVIIDDDFDKIKKDIEEGFGTAGNSGFLVYGVSEFVLVVELYEASPGYTYVLEDISNYQSAGKNAFQKTVQVKTTDDFAEINICSASEKPIEPVTVKYTVGDNVLEHYLSSDPDATSGVQNSSTFNAGDIVYLFAKPVSDSERYYYQLPISFEAIGDGWYRSPVFVCAEDADLGVVKATKMTRTFTVTWKNWDGSIIYVQKYSYGSKPAYNTRYGTPTKPADELYGYKFIGWGTEIIDDAGNTIFTALFEQGYLVKVEPTENGTVTPDGDNFIKPEDRHTYLFEAAPGYKVKDVIVNGESVGAVTSYTFTGVGSHQTLKVEFEKIEYTLNIVVGENGSADRSGASIVKHGDSVTVNITPAELFAIESIRINGEKAEITNALTLGNITEDTLVEIAFKQVAFNITCVTGANGTVTPSVTTPIGENVRVDFDAKPFYKVKDVVIDGVSIGAVDHYVFLGVSGDHSVSVEYELDVMLIVLVSAALVLIILAARSYFSSRHG